MTKAPIMKLIEVYVVSPHFTGGILRHQKLSKRMEDTHCYLHFFLPTASDSFPKFRSPR